MCTELERVAKCGTKKRIGRNDEEWCKFLKGSSIEHWTCWLNIYILYIDEWLVIQIAKDEATLVGVNLWYSLKNCQGWERYVPKANFSGLGNLEETNCWYTFHVLRRYLVDIINCLTFVILTQKYASGNNEKGMNHAPKKTPLLSVTPSQKLARLPPQFHYYHVQCW